MEAVLANWKTTSAGVAAILVAVADMLSGFSTGNTGHLAADITAIIGGVGLIAAKDAVTKGS